MTVALVLSGGGSRGAFQVGACRYLYDHDIRPDIICGSSVGAINGAKLAEASPNDRLAANHALDQLEALWLGLNVAEDMYVLAPWLASKPAVKALIQGRLAEAIGMEIPLGTNPGWLGFLWKLVVLEEDPQVIVALREFFTSAQSIYELTPIAELLRTSFDPDSLARSKVQLRLGVVSLEAGALRYVTENGELLERDLKTKVGRTAVPGGVPAACQLLQDQHDALDQKLNEALKDFALAAAHRDVPGTLIAHARMRRAEKDLEKARLSLSACLDTAMADSEGPPVVFLRDAVLASSAIPGIFAPVSLLGETYVDGGVREVLPLAAAEQLGADQIYAIVASPLGAPRKSSFAARPILEIAIRAVAEIMPDEILLGEVVDSAKLVQRLLQDDWTKRKDDAKEEAKRRASEGHDRGGTLAGVVGSIPGTIVVDAETAAEAAAVSAAGTMPAVHVIFPRLDVYDIITVDPDLIRIYMAYGFMRAADVVENQHESNAGTAEDITTIRLALLQSLRGGDAAAAVEHRALLQQNVQARAALGLPVHAWPGGLGVVD